MKEHVTQWCDLSLHWCVFNCFWTTVELQGTKESDIFGFDSTDNTRKDQLIVVFFQWDLLVRIIQKSPDLFPLMKPAQCIFSATGSKHIWRRICWHWVGLKIIPNSNSNLSDKKACASLLWWISVTFCLFARPPSSHTASAHSLVNGEIQSWVAA